MIIYTIGFTQKTAREFFEPIKKNEIQLLIDVRLNNQSQLAGFTKEKDLTYFLESITDCKYVHDLTFAPTKMLLDDYKKGKINWDGYVEVFQKLIASRKMVEHFDEKYKSYDRVVLLCSEPTPENCHRRLIAEAVAAKLGHKIIHL
ncbi:MAG: DUF488 domain-containing protein [Lachnospiraceae bacterium]|nr:DUF488 domain-containing protein [Lachnospiraceae bacterium]